MAELTASTGKTTGRNRRKRMSTRIDLTAMVDLAFLLITFFILTTTLEKPRMFNVTMPTDEQTKPPLMLSEKQAVNICLGKDNKVVLYRGMTENPLTTPKVTDFGMEGLRKELIEDIKKIKADINKDAFIIIKASDHSVYENLVSALDELHIANATGYAIEDITPAEVNLLKQKGVY